MPSVVLARVLFQALVGVKKKNDKGPAPEVTHPPPQGEAERPATGALTLRTDVSSKRSLWWFQAGHIIQLGGMRRLLQRGDKLSYLLNESVNRWERKPDAGAVDFKNVERDCFWSFKWNSFKMSLGWKEGRKRGLEGQGCWEQEDQGKGDGASCPGSQRAIPASSCWPRNPLLLSERGMSLCSLRTDLFRFCSSEEGVGQRRVREIGLVRNGSAGSTNTLGERGGRNAPSPPLSWDWRPGGRKGLLPWAHRSHVLQRVKLWSLGTIFHRLLT